MHFTKVTIAGVGLLGGSLGLALKERRLADLVTGFVRRQASVAECIRAGAVDEATTDVQEAVAGADLVILCTPIARMGSLAREMLPALKPGAIVTDVGSVKAAVVKELEPMLARAGVRFVGSHPMAGSEKMGVSAARADLFMNAVCVVTPTKRSQPKAVKVVEQFWKKLGARLLRLDPDLHDQLVARSSHLPHLLAAQLVNFVLDPAHPLEQGSLCANGFRDTTRIASGSPEMWRDIALSNRKHLGRAVGRLIKDLQKMEKLIAQGDLKSIEAMFTKAKARRDAWLTKAVTRSPE